MVLKPVTNEDPILRAIVTGPCWKRQVDSESCHLEVGFLLSNKMNLPQRFIGETYFMDDNLKRSLMFGGVVGGLYALGRNAIEKSKLTPGQAKDVNVLKEATVKLQNIAGDRSLATVLSMAKSHESDKQYGEVITQIDAAIETCNAHFGAVDSFKAALDQVLGSRFTAERANAATHALQSHISSLTPLPDRLEALINKRIEMLRFLKKSLASITPGEATDFKLEDEATLRTLAEEHHALTTRIIGIFGSVKFE